MRVRDGVVRPRFGWGKARPDTVGKVRTIKDNVIVVDFPEYPMWQCLESEIEIVPDDQSATPHMSGNFDNNLYVDRVQVYF